MTESPKLIYRLIAREAWQQAEVDGHFAGSEHDVRDGFLHFSTAAQLRETAAKHYAGAENLLVLHVDVSALPSPLRWEPSRNDELFPHLYGPLPINTVRRIDPLPLGADGQHSFDAVPLVP